MFNNIAHEYSKYANQTLDWVPMDTKELYAENLRNNHANLEKFGWLNNTVSYKFNSYGFRSDEFSLEPNMVSLGCSHTCGIGIPIENSWTSIVSNNLNLKNFNLGVGGSSNDTAFRIAHNWLPQLKPKVVVYLSPDRCRFEYHSSPDIRNYGPWSNDALWKSWISDDTNSDVNFLKNTLAIKNICNDLNIKLIHVEYNNLSSLGVLGIYNNDYDLARDLAHDGIKANQSIANYILSKL
jgi:hypothetical protein